MHHLGEGEIVAALKRFPNIYDLTLMSPVPGSLNQDFKQILTEVLLQSQWNISHVTDMTTAPDASAPNAP